MFTIICKGDFDFSYHKESHLKTSHRYDELYQIHSFFLKEMQA
jgi:hypothetical protein